MSTKYIFVTGGVLSGLGKGITAASMGKLLKARGYSVNLQKLDPYLNVDAGTLNPAEHGECYVTKDGAETDLDLGHYERFLDIETTQASSVMSGRILRNLIQDERDGKYLGKTVQAVPHFTDAIQEYVFTASKGFDIHIVEIGGTVGDYESPAFFEAIREIATKKGVENCLYVQVVYLPYLGASKEIKTKPAQNAVRDLRSLGIQPDILVARCEVMPQADVTTKLSAFGGVEKEAIAVLPNAPSIYQVPLTLEDEGIGEVIVNKLGLKKSKRAKLKDWRAMVDKVLGEHKHTVTVGVVAKYMDNEDTYMSVFEALRAAGWNNSAKVDIKWIDSEKLKSEKHVAKELSGLDGIVVPGGFGSRGVDGKIIAAQYAMKNKLPYLGLCLGLQVAVVAAARNAGFTEATSQELDPTADSLVISTMAGQKGKENTGGSMRLGNYNCILDSKSIAKKLYKSTKIVERHRHRYECNNDFRDQYESWGIKATGLSPDKHLVEMIEAIDHPFMVASQFHPEFKSRPDKAHPLFNGFIRSALLRTKN